MEKNVLILISSRAVQREQVANQDRALTILRSRGFEPEIVDGADPAQQERRNKFFAVSGLRGKYPQFFVSSVNGEEEGPNTSFLLGTFEEIEAMNDAGTLTPENILDGVANSKEVLQAKLLSSSEVVLDSDEEDDNGPLFCCGFIPRWLVQLAKPDLLQPMDA